MRPPDRASLGVLAVALATFASLGAALPSVWGGTAAISDVPVYERYGDAVERGSVPYRDFRPEYPPGALGAFVVPSLVSSGARGYARAFGVEMLLCGAAALVACFAALLALGATGLRLAAGLAPLAASPLLLGPLVLTRFDLYPAALAAAAVAALVAGRDRLGGGLLGAAVAVKLYPGVLLPLALAWTWRRRGRREALAVLATCLAVVAAVVLPFLAVAPDGVASSVRRQLDRPLQIESAGAALLLALHHVAGMPLAWSSSHGSQNLTGGVALAAAIATSAVQAAALVWLWQRYARTGSASAAGLADAAAAALVVFVALGKVLSPQFLVWLLPAVALVGGRRFWLGAGLLAAACLLTRAWFPDRYWRLVFAFDERASWLVALRDACLLALVVASLRALRPTRPAAAARSA